MALLGMKPTQPQRQGQEAHGPTTDAHTGGISEIHTITTDLVLTAQLEGSLMVE